jgi:hypothetical protein
MAFMPPSRLGTRCFGASLPMRISASWFGSTVGSTACKDVATMTQPLEAGSASCRVIFVVLVPPRGGIPDSSCARKEFLIVFSPRGRSSLSGLLSNRASGISLGLSVAARLRSAKRPGRPQRGGTTGRVCPRLRRLPACSCHESMLPHHTGRKRLKKEVFVAPFSLLTPKVPCKGNPSSYCCGRLRKRAAKKRHDAASGWVIPCIITIKTRHE